MNKLADQLDKLFTKQRWIVHTFFWLAVLIVYAVIFGHKHNNYSQTLFLVSLLLPVTITTSYFLNYYLLPRYLMKERYGLFLIYFIYLLIGSLCLEMLIVTFTFLIMAERKIAEMSPASIDMFVVLAALLMIVFLGGAIKLLLHWRNSKEDYQKLMREKVEVELRFLKTQLHPHFLFNTLNNLYYLALEKSDKTPSAILALSELLDYVLHDTKATFVPLEKELKQVENYIALESLRYQDRLSVDVKVRGDLKQKRIAPMMLITLVENSFKHGVTQTIDKAWITLDVISDGEKITVEIKNSVTSKTKEVSSGLGLKNLRSQLSLLYDNRSQMKIDAHENSFAVKLELIEVK
jgi:sensor histidine kinase YesM